MTTGAPSPSTETTPYDDMALVFDTIVNPSPTPTLDKDDKAAAAAPADKTSDAPSDASATTDTTTEAAPADKEDATPPADPASAAPDKDASDATPPAATDGIDWKARFEELQARVERDKDTTATPPVEQPPADPAPSKDVYSADETTTLKKYREEWPEVAAGEALIRRKENYDLVDHIFSEINRVYGPVLAQIAPTVSTVEHTTALAAIREKHPDYDDAMFDAVVEWTDTLSGYDQRLAKGIIEDGDTKDVVELISRYKKVNGLDKPRVVATTTQASQAATLSEPAKQAAKALEVVDSKRSAPLSGAPDMTDFDGAWGEATARK